MSEAAAREMRWTVNGLELAGLAWGDPAATPLLALHGWLDNAASFAVLAPLLDRFHVVAMDLSGHGRSDHRSADAGYQIWEDLPELVGVVDQLGWEQFCLMGHSRGAAIACLLAAAFPERVKRLVLLDGIAPEPVEEARFALQLRAHIEDKKYWSARRKRIYATMEEAESTRTAQALPAGAASMLVARNLRRCEGGYCWTTDMRLRGASSVKLTAGHIRAVLEALEMPSLLLLAEQGLGRQVDLAAPARRHMKHLQLEQVDGGHHFHMGPGAADIAARVNCFLQS